MEKTAAPMTSGPIGRRMIIFALPLMLGNLFQQLYNTVDSLIVGNTLGSSALAAVSSSGSLIFMLIGFIGGLGVGAGVVIAQLCGAGDEKRLQLAVHTTVAFGLISGAAVSVIGPLLAPLILRWMGTPESVMPEAVCYLRIYLGGAVGLVLYNVFVGILQAVGDSRHPLYYLIFSSAVNLVLDLLFIVGFGSGVDGAAIATVISQLLSAALCLRRLMRARDGTRVELRKIRLNGPLLRQIIRIGLPSGLQNSIIALANVVVQSYTNSFGAMAMAGCGAYSKVEGFGFLPINSFVLALTTFVGQNLGAGQKERARKGARFGLLVCVGTAELIGLVIYLFAPEIIGAFDPNPAVVAFGVDKARVTTLFYCLLAYSHGVSAVLRGAGKSTVPMLVMVICWCGIRVLFLSLAVPLSGSIQALYWAYPLTWSLSSGFFLFYYRRAWGRLEEKSGLQ